MATWLDQPPAQAVWIKNPIAGPNAVAITDTSAVIDDVTARTDRVDT